MKSLNLLSAVAVLALAGSTQAAVFATSSASTSVGPTSPGQHVGHLFTVGASPLSVTHLGGFDAAAVGGTGLVNVNLWNSSGAIVASVQVTYDGSDDYSFAALGSPVVLSAGQQYFVGVGGPNGAFAGAEGATFAGSPTDYTVTNDVFYPNGQTPVIGLGSDLPAGFYASGNFQYTVVPEPETYAMIAGLGLVGFGLWRRRQAK